MDGRSFGNSVSAGWSLRKRSIRRINASGSMRMMIRFLVGRFREEDENRSGSLGRNRNRFIIRFIIRFVIRFIIRFCWINRSMSRNRFWWINGSMSRNGAIIRLRINRSGSIRNRRRNTIRFYWVNSSVWRDHLIIRFVIRFVIRLIIGLRLGIKRKGRLRDRMCGIGDVNLIDSGMIRRRISARFHRFHWFAGRGIESGRRMSLKGPGFAGPVSFGQMLVTFHGGPRKRQEKPAVSDRNTVYSDQQDQEPRPT